MLYTLSTPRISLADILTEMLSQREVSLGFSSLPSLQMSWGRPKSPFPCERTQRKNSLCFKTSLLGLWMVWVMLHPDADPPSE